MYTIYAIVNEKKDLFTVQFISQIGLDRKCSITAARIINFGCNVYINAV